MLQNYGYIGLYFIVALGFTLLMVLIPVALRFLKVVPDRPNLIKNSVFECGMETIGKTWVQFNFHYYFYALVFVALDVMVIFLYPWAVALRQLGLQSLIIIISVIFIIFIGFLYAWKKKVLEWK